MAVTPTKGSNEGSKDGSKDGGGLRQRGGQNGDAATEKSINGKAPVPSPTATYIGEHCDTCPIADFTIPSSFDWHPGGQLSLETGRRSDCPGLLFLSLHMGSDIDGKVLPACRALGVKVPQRGKMYKEMHAAIRKVKAAHPELHGYFIAYCLLLTVVLTVFFFWFILSPGFIVATVVAFVFELYFLNVFHTRHHQGGQIYQNKFLQRITTPFYNFLDSTWGYYPYAWRFNHHVKHHVFTNDSETDSDVPAMWPLIRATHDQPMRWWHKAQSFYWPLLMPFASVNFPLNNILEHGGSSFHFAAWILIMFVIPVILHGKFALVYSLWTQGLAGGSLAYKFAVSHGHNDLRTAPTSKESYADSDEWIAAQIEESMSYGGFVTTFIFGGIGRQIEHHIAPCLDPPLYHYIAPELERIARKYGIKYTTEPSFSQAVWQFHSKLWAMGWAP